MSETSPITQHHINRFQNRARLHFRISYAILAGILGLFFFLIYIFLFAQEIDKSKGSVEIFAELQIGLKHEQQVVDAAKPLAEQQLAAFKTGYGDITGVLTADEALAEANIKLSLFNEQSRLMQELGYVPDIDNPRSKEELLIVSNGKKELKDAASAVLQAAQAQYDTGYSRKSDVLQAELLVTRATLDQELFAQRASTALPAAQQKQVTTNLNTIELVRTSLIRFGGAAMVLFLISLLMPIYRYNVRLGTFYQARADTLLLSRDINVQNFPEMTRLMTPAYAFEKEPTTPVESLASFVKEASGVVRKI